MNIKELAIKMSSAVETLESLGYTYEGEEYWKPSVEKENEPWKWEDGEKYGLPLINSKCILIEEGNEIVVTILGYSNNGTVAVLVNVAEPFKLFGCNPKDLISFKEHMIDGIASTMGRGTFYEDAKNIYEKFIEKD